MAAKVGSGSGAVAIAMAFAGRTARACQVCATKSALWYCEADEAYLCTACDTQVHSANALSLRHERVRLTPNGTPKNRSSPLSTLVPEELYACGVQAASRKRVRTSRPYSHHLRKLTRLSNQLVSKDGTVAEDSLAAKAGLELFHFLDSDEFLNNAGNQEVPTISPASSDLEFFSSDLDEFHDGDHTASADSFAAFFKGKAAHSQSVSDQFLVPDADFRLTVDTATAPADTHIDLASDAFFFPGDIPGLDGFQSFVPEVDLNDDFSRSFDLALQNHGLDAFEGNGSVTSQVTGTVAQECKTGSPSESTDQFAAGPFAKFFATKTRAELEEPMNPERIKREAREMLRCCGDDATQKVPSLQLNLKEVLAAWSDRGEPWVDFKASDDSTSSGSDAGLVPDMDGDRDARVLRYKEKRRTRLFSKKIRYEVRKLNAERRPRMKGRFVKRTTTSS